MDINQNNTNISDYFRSSTNTEAEKEASRSITQKFTANIVMHLQEFDTLRAH